MTAQRLILVHGAYHGGWCWRHVAPKLEQNGFQVETPDLPGSGADTTPLPDVDLDACVAKISDLVTSASEPVVLAGHSYAGAIINQVAENHPEKIDRLVYITAYLPGDGENITHWARQDKDTAVKLDRVDLAGTRAVRMNDDALVPAFYADCSEDDIAFARARLRPQVIAPFQGRLQLSDGRFGQVQKKYIACDQDRAISPALQQAMTTAMGLTDIVHFDAGHCPYFSMPEALAEACSA